MSGWFSARVIATGRLPLFCFFVAFLTGFALIRLSARMIRAKVRWWPGNVTAGAVHIHHMVFGVVLVGVGGVAELAAPVHSLAWRAAPAVVFGFGMALVLDEFALILHLRDVYWSNEGRVSIDAVFMATAVTALLLIGVAPVGLSRIAGLRWGPVSLTLTWVIAVLFVVAAVTLLKGKIWTCLFGVFVPPLLVVGAIRLARPGSPWARWRYGARPGKQDRAAWREQRLRGPVIRAKIWLQELVGGSHDLPSRG